MGKNHILNRLIHLAVKDSEDIQDPKARLAVGKLSGAIGIVCNLILAGSKLLVGMLASSMSIMADGLNNLSDAASSIVTLIGFRLAEKPADADHPYGHARYEYLSGLAVAAIAGIALNAVLPGKDYEFGQDEQGDTSVNFKV